MAEKLVPQSGIEPPTSSLPMKYSTPELLRHITIERRVYAIEGMMWQASLYRRL